MSQGIFWQRSSRALTAVARDVGFVGKTEFESLLKDQPGTHIAVLRLLAAKCIPHERHSLATLT
ncbi:MAG: hypothetical protein ABSE96_24245 [Terracidiphilus sp.]